MSSSDARSRILGLLALVVLSALFACSTSHSAPPRPEPGQSTASTTVSVALSSEPAGFNVHESTLDSRLLREIVGTMWPSAYRIRPDYSVEPWLLSAPAAVVSSDPFVVEWRIRPDANWSDGVPVTADDFELLYQQCSRPGATCPDAAGYASITKFEKADAKTVRTTFAAPNADYAELFRYVPPSHVLSARTGGWDHGFDADPGPSAGPFKFQAWRHGEGIVLVRNDDYFGTDPSIDRLVFRFVDAGAQLDALRSGDVDVIAPPAMLDVVNATEGQRGVTTHLGFSADAEALVFNLHNPFLAIPGVRRAIALGIDRNAIVESLVRPIDAGAIRLDNRIFGIDEDAYERHGDEFASRSPERAQAELVNAGFVKGPEGIFERGGTRLALRLSTTSGDRLEEQEVQLVQAQLAEIGIAATIDNRSPGAFDAALHSGDFDIAALSRPATAFAVSAATERYGTGGADNVGGLSDPRVDDLLSRAQGELDEQARARLLNEADQTLWDVVPDVPLFERPALLAHDARLDGVVANPTSQGDLWNVEDWLVTSSG